uniref:Uncharacterized protein n=1 Tax=Zea mays TaxID=4577 RepID=A0A804MI79_MAIZE
MSIAVGTNMQDLQGQGQKGENVEIPLLGRDRTFHNRERDILQMRTHFKVSKQPPTEALDSRLFAIRIPGADELSPDELERLMNHDHGWLIANPH